MNSNKGIMNVYSRQITTMVYTCVLPQDLHRCAAAFLIKNKALQLHLTLVTAHTHHLASAAAVAFLSATKTLKQSIRTLCVCSFSIFASGFYA
jgi:hypothetical protein